MISVYYTLCVFSPIFPYVLWKDLLHTNNFFPAFWKEFSLKKKRESVWKNINLAPNSSYFCDISGMGFWNGNLFLNFQSRTNVRKWKARLMKMKVGRPWNFNPAYVANIYKSFKIITETLLLFVF